MSDDSVETKAACGESSLTGGLGVWRPIATAPKDGTAVLGYFPRRRGYAARQDCCPIAWCGWGGGVWQNTTSGHNILGDEPTHWTPLPEAPNAELSGPRPLAAEGSRSNDVLESMTLGQQENDDGEQA